MRASGAGEAWEEADRCWAHKEYYKSRLQNSKLQVKKM